MHERRYLVGRHAPVLPAGGRRLDSLRVVVAIVDARRTQPPRPRTRRLLLRLVERGTTLIGRGSTASTDPGEHVGEEPLDWFPRCPGLYSAHDPVTFKTVTRCVTIPAATNDGRIPRRGRRINGNRPIVSATIKVVFAQGVPIEQTPSSRRPLSRLPRCAAERRRSPSRRGHEHLRELQTRTLLSQESERHRPALFVHGRCTACCRPALIGPALAACGSDDERKSESR